MFKTVGVLGSGVVSETLANGLLKSGYTVMRGSRDPAKLADWRAQAGNGASTGTFEETAHFGEAVVLAVKGTAAESLVAALAPALAGKPVIDTTNPIAEAPPEHGVLRYFTGPNDSLLERLQALAPAAHFVKAFSCVGNAHMVQPGFRGGAPTMFICGRDADAKAQVQTLLEQFGWDVADMGNAEAARAIEPLCQLWCIPGLLNNQWGHAFKLLRQ